MKKLFLISILSVFTFAMVIAQDKSGPTSNIFEKIKAEKISFFTEKLNLTPSEAQVFWPVYNEFEKKRFDLQRDIHDFERIPDDKFDSLSDAEIEKMMNNYINSFEQEAMLLKDYNKRFLKILPKVKVLKMYRTENQFRGHLLRVYKRGQ